MSFYCENCGTLLPDDAKFCENCGALVENATAREQNDRPGTDTGNVAMIPQEPGGTKKKKKVKIASEGIYSREGITGQKVTENIYLCPDGKYRWIYEYRMLKNPAILITVLKVILLSFGIVMGFMALLHVIGGDYRYWNSSDYLSFARGFLILLLVLLALGVVSYLILAAIYGWSYQVLLTMDEDGVELRQMQKEFQKTQAIGWLTAAAGQATGNVGQIGTGILTATRDSSTSVFQQVRKVKSVRRRHVIYVNQLLGHNQVYAEDADFDFVREFIVRHCPNAKISD